MRTRSRTRPAIATGSSCINRASASGAPAARLRGLRIDRIAEILTTPLKSPSDHERLAAIEKAKHEWEFTVDALTAVVCLLDPDGIVLRANRVVEHWGLGSVGGVIGKSAHSILHPACSDANC